MSYFAHFCLQCLKNNIAGYEYALSYIVDDEERKLVEDIKRRYEEGDEDIINKLKTLKDITLIYT